MPDREALLVLTTCPDAAVARRLAAELVERRLAACVNQLPGIASTYRWQGGVEHDDEVLLLIKTTPARYAAVEHAVTELHPYELPEVIAVPVRAGLSAYLDWIAANTKAD